MNDKIKVSPFERRRQDARAKIRAEWAACRLAFEFVSANEPHNGAGIQTLQEAELHARVLNEQAARVKSIRLLRDMAAAATEPGHVARSIAGAAWRRRDEARRA